MSNTDGLITMVCDYCEVLIGFIDYKPTIENVNLVGAQFCCIACKENRQATPQTTVMEREDI